MELQLDYANIIRLDGSTSVEISELGNRRFRVRLLEGRITYSELKNGEADIDMDTARRLFTLICALHWRG